MEELKMFQKNYTEILNDVEKFQKKKKLNQLKDF